MLLSIINIIGLVAFAFSGSVKGFSRRMDLFGVFLLGVITALGGGAVRDLLVNRMPVMLTDPAYLACSLLGALLALAFRRRGTVIVNRWIFLVSDALGLAFFTAAGCLVAREYGLGLVGILMLGTLTAVGGGMIRDVLAGEVPMVLRREVYASCSLLGGLGFWLAGLAGSGPFLASLACMLPALALRLLAIRGHWQIPRP